MLIRTPRDMEDPRRTAYLCDWRVLVNGAVWMDDAQSAGDSLTALYYALHGIAFALDRLQDDGLLRWPGGGGRDVGIPGLLMYNGRLPLDARRFELESGRYFGSKTVLGSYTADLTPREGAALSATVRVRQPRPAPPGWLSDYELDAGPSRQSGAAARGSDSLAALHASVVGAFAALESLKDEGTLTWMGTRMEVGVPGLLHQRIDMWAGQPKPSNY